MKNGSCPSGVTVAVLSHSTWMRPEKVSATTGPAHLDSTTGCSPIGSPGKSPRFVPIPHGNKGLRNRRMPRTQVSRIIKNQFDDLIKYRKDEIEREAQSASSSSSEPLSSDAADAIYYFHRKYVALEEFQYVINA